MLRGLAMDFTTDTRTFDIDNAYMVGTSLLGRPVFHPQSEEKNICIYPVSYTHLDVYKRQL